jgi:hypothetical protein
MDFIGSVLAKLAAQPSDPIEQDSQEIVIGRNVPKNQVRDLAVRLGLKEPRVEVDKGARDSKPIVGKRLATTDNTGKPLVHAIPLPDKGTLDARSFLLAMRDAGRRKTAEGLWYIDQTEIRHDQIKAIAAYIGYDGRLNFGEQELAAKLHAKSELFPQPIDRSEWRRSGTPRNAPHGTVFGMPDMLAARQANLEAREREAAERLAGYRRDFLDAKRTQDQRRESQVMMELEDQRIAEIRADLRRLPGWMR